MTISNLYTVTPASLVRASTFLFFGDFVLIFLSYLGQHYDIWMRDGGNGAQESSLGWELSHGAPDPSLVEGFRPSADFHPCLSFSVFDVS